MPRRRSVFTTALVSSALAGGQPHVIEDLRHAILAGDEPPGTLIPIDAVADFFRCSPIPVREALKVLLGEGLVEHVPHVGYSVAMLAFAEFRELYDVRQALETSALRASVTHATPDDDGAVRRAHRAMGAALGTDDLRAYQTGSRQFHIALLAPARMPRLTHIYEATWNMTEPARPMSRISRERRATFHADHGRMLEAFEARDATTLVHESDLHFDHIRSAIETFRDDPDLFRES